MQEIWKDVIGYEGYYQVSNLGRVKSLARNIDRGQVIQKREGKIKRQWANPDGYLQVKLCKDGKNKNIGTHILVAKAFIENKDYKDGWEVNHKDFNRTNNNVDNLEWVTRQENIAYSAKANHMKHYGKDNPNYGNDTLKNKYREHPELTQMQSRKGAKNGYAIPIYVENIETGKKKYFGYILEAANYFIDNNLTVKPIKNANTFGIKIKRYIDEQTIYNGYKFTYA